MLDRSCHKWFAHNNETFEINENTGFQTFKLKKKINYVIFYVNVSFIGEKMVLQSLGKDKQEFETTPKRWNVYKTKIKDLVTLGRYAL